MDDKLMLIALRASGFRRCVDAADTIERLERELAAEKQVSASLLAEIEALKRLADEVEVWDALVFSEGNGPSEEQVDAAEQSLHENLAAYRKAQGR